MNNGSSKTRILILSSSTGSGHDMRAKAIAEWIERDPANEVKIKIEQIIENASRLGKFGVGFYNLIQRHWPALHHIYFFIVEVFTWFHAKRVTYGGRYYRNLLRRYQPNIVLSLHDSTNRGYFEDARRVLGADKVRCITYCGEFSGGYGFSRNWVNPTADQFFARTTSCAEHAQKLGLSKDRIGIFAKVLPPEVFAPPLSPAELENYKESLGFSPSKWTLFLATGGYGANHHIDFLKALLPLAQSVQAIVICGRNQAIHQRLQQWSLKHPQLRLFIEGYSFRVHEFLQVSDAIITRGGANTTMEALHYNCPILYNTLGGLMPQEHCTTRYFLENRAAKLLRSSHHLTRIIRDWIEHPEHYQTLKTNLEKLNPEESPLNWIRSLITGEPYEDSSPQHP